MHNWYSIKPTAFYSLDAIISVGYRVKSTQGAKFRIWANRILKDYLIKGFATQEKLKLDQLQSLKKTVALLANVVHNKELTAGEATGLIQVVTDYAYALDILDRYDHREIRIESVSEKQLFVITYDEAINALVTLTLMIAESNPAEKDMMVKVVVSLINQNN